MYRWNAALYAAQKPCGLLKQGLLKCLSAFRQKHGSEYSSNPDIHPDQPDPAFGHQHSPDQGWLYQPHGENTPYLAYPHGPLTLVQRRKEQVRISKIKRFSSWVIYHQAFVLTMYNTKTLTNRLQAATKT